MGGGHFALLNHPEVYDRLRDWLGLAAADDLQQKRASSRLEPSRRPSFCFQAAVATSRWL